jgi:hypothetical protein
MADDSKTNVAIAIFEVASGNIVMEYRETPTSIFSSRGPEVASVKPAAMLYASD